MALKAVHVSDVPNLDQIPENASLSLCSSRIPKGFLIFLKKILFLSWSIIVKLMDVYLSFRCRIWENGV